MSDADHVPQMAEPDPSQIGLRLRMQRHARRQRLKDLAAASNCSESLLSRIENGLIMPSLTTLHRVCQALEISITSLLSHADEKACVIYGPNDRPSYTKGGWIEGDRSTAESLVPYAPGRLLEAHVISVPAHGAMCGPYKHAGEEVGYVLSGELELVVNSEIFLVKTEHSFFFQSDLEHCYRAHGKKDCRILWINTPSSF